MPKPKKKSTGNKIKLPVAKKKKSANKAARAKADAQRFGPVLDAQQKMERMNATAKAVRARALQWQPKHRCLMHTHDRTWERSFPVMVQELAADQRAVYAEHDWYIGRPGAFIVGDDLTIVWDECPRNEQREFPGELHIELDTQCAEA